MSDRPTKTNRRNQAGNTPRYFEEIQIGESHTIENTRTVTETDVVNFAGLSGDLHPYHMSKEFGKDSHFGKRVAHGNLIFVMTGGIASNALPRNPHIVSSYGHDHLRFVEPVFIGDTLTVHVEVVDKCISNENVGMVTKEFRTENQSGDTVLVYRHIILVERNLEERGDSSNSKPPSE